MQLPPRRRNILVRSLVALVAAVAPLAALAPAARAQTVADTYFYAGGVKRPLVLSSRWQGLQLDGSQTAWAVRGAANAETGIDKNAAPIMHLKKQVLLLPVQANAGWTTRQNLKTRLQGLRGVRQGLRVFENGAWPIVETDEILVRFKPGIKKGTIDRLLQPYGAGTVQPLMDTPNGFLVRVKDAVTHAPTAVADALYESGSTVFAQPNYIWPKQKRFVPNDPLFANQWYLNNSGQNAGSTGADVKAEGAWDYTRGSSNITIAVIDDGIDTAHEDFAGKIVAGYDFADNDSDPRPAVDDTATLYGDDHGTACAGVATANGNNSLGVSGIAPGCKLMPIRLLGDNATLQDEHDSFVWAADHGADIISCSWGPPDGTGVSQPLPDSTKQGIDYATTSGRGGKGCVVFFASGNGSESSDLDGYASYSKVINVGASTNSDAHASYSDFGSSVDLAAPSNGGTLAITTTDRTGVQGYDSGNYTDIFGGTSSACPLAAGVGALVLSLDPSLTRDQVQEVLQNTADKVGGVTYSNGHNDQFGYGRVNALRAAQAVASDFKISGKVTLSGSGTGLQGVQLVSSASGNSTFSGADGSYTLLGVAAGTTRITASKTGYFFASNGPLVTVGPSATGINFVATRYTVTLTAPVAGATVSGTSPLSAATNNDSMTQNVSFQRRIAPASFSRSPALHIPDAVTGDNGITTPGVVSDSQVVSEGGTGDTASISVNISHTWIGDLIVTLTPPAGQPIILQNRQGDNGVNIVTTYADVPLGGIALNGTWKLTVSDNQDGDVGILNSWGMTINPTWTTLATDSNGPTGGTWTGLWNTASTTPGTYQVRALAATSDGSFDDIHSDVKVVANLAKSISGRVVNGLGDGVPNVTMSLTGTKTLSVKTDSNGNFNFADTGSGTYLIKPALTSTAFLPANKSVTVADAAVTGINFTAVPAIVVTQPLSLSINRNMPRGTGKTANRSGGGVTQVRCVLFRFAHPANGNDPAVAAGYWAGGSSWTPTLTTANELLADGTANFALTFPTLAQGEYWFRGIAIDGGGNRIWQTITFYIDTTLPTLVVNGPTDGATYDAAALSGATGTAADSGGAGLKEVRGTLYRYAQPASGGNPAVPAGYWAGGTTWNATYDLAVHRRLANGTANWSFPFPTLTAGNYLLRIDVWDKAMNNVFKTNAFKITGGGALAADHVAPTLTVNQPLNAQVYPTLTTASGTVDDDNSGVKEARCVLYRYAQTASGGNAAVPAGYWAGGTTWDAVYDAATHSRLATGIANWSYTLPALSAGKYILRTDAFDNSGNNVFKSNTFMVQGAVGGRIEPTSTVTLSTAGAQAAGVAALQFTGALDGDSASDPGNYSVQTGAGAEIGIAAVTVGANGLVTLQTAAPLTIGGRITVSWHGLRDAQGLAVNDGAVQLTVKSG